MGGFSCAEFASDPVYQLTLQASGAACLPYVDASSISGVNCTDVVPVVCRLAAAMRGTAVSVQSATDIVLLAYQIVMSSWHKLPVSVGANQESDT
jgi:hypothetical protein